MFSEVSAIIALLAFGAVGWWLYEGKSAVRRKLDEEQSELERHDHACAYEQAKVQAELQRWSGPH